MGRKRTRPKYTAAQTRVLLEIAKDPNKRREVWTWNNRISWYGARPSTIQALIRLGGVRVEDVPNMPGRKYVVLTDLESIRGLYIQQEVAALATKHRNDIINPFAIARNKAQQMVYETHRLFNRIVEDVRSTEADVVMQYRKLQEARTALDVAMMAYTNAVNTYTRPSDEELKVMYITNQLAEKDK